MQQTSPVFRECLLLPDSFSYQKVRCERMDVVSFTFLFYGGEGGEVSIPLVFNHHDIKDTLSFPILYNWVGTWEVLIGSFHHSSVRW